MITMRRKKNSGKDNDHKSANNSSGDIVLFPTVFLLLVLFPSSHKITVSSLPVYNVGVKGQPCSGH